MIISVLFLGLGIAGVLIAGLLAGFFIQRRLNTKRIGDANDLARRIIEEARKEAQAQKKEILVQGQDELFNQKRELENEYKEQERELKGREKKLQDMSERMEEKMERLTQKEQDLLLQERDQTRKERRLEEQEEKLCSRMEEQERRLQEVSGLTVEEAKKRLFEEIESRTRHEAAKMMRHIESDAREAADRKAREILACAIQRYAGDYVGEQTVTAVTLPSEDMKGRIIGREGRNIRALEAATGVDLIIDDTPETVILSAYSPIRRQVARMALERLIQDGRIHPARIEDIVHKCEQELDVQVREVGEQATFDAGVHGIHPDIVRLLGQLKYRTSFTQNVLQHSLEVSALCGMMAAELGMDIKRAKRAGLLHDIGKAVDHEVEGSHAVIGADIAKKCGEGKDIIHAIAAHHEDIRPEQPWRFWFRRRTPCPVRAPARAKNYWKTTSSAWKIWKTSLRPSTAFPRPTPFRPDANSALWSIPTMWMTIPPTCCAGISRARLKKTLHTPAKSASRSSASAAPWVLPNRVFAMNSPCTVSLDFRPDFSHPSAPQCAGRSLIAAIAQDAASGEVLMLGWMDEEAWNATLSTGEAHYFSRSRAKLWHKGERSGNVQKVRAIRLDCDADAVVLEVEQVGGAACHEGYRSCFFRRAELAPCAETGICCPRVFDPAMVYQQGK